MSSTRNPKVLLADVLCSEIVDVHADSETIVANLEVIGPTGAVISSDLPLRRGRSVLVQGPVSRFAASVAKCRADKILGYQISLTFTGKFRWTKAAFSPMHMLDLKELAKQAGRHKSRQPASKGRVFSAGGAQ